MSEQKIAVVTGANTGLGLETTIGLAQADFSVVLACRNEEKANQAMKKVLKKVGGANLDFIPLDLIDRDSIRAFASEYQRKYKHLDVLVNNAGVMGPPETITQNGLELQFDANHIGHFLLTSLLMPVLNAAVAARVINVSSLAGKWPGAEIKFDNLNWDGVYDQSPEDFMGLEGMGAYGQSKLANILFTMELKDRLTATGSAIVPLVVHPGASNTDLSRNMSPAIRFLIPVLAIFMNVSTPAEGAQPTLMAALKPDVYPGDFYGPTGKEERTGKAGLVDLPEKAHDKALCERLWTLSEESVGEPFRLA